MFKFDERRAEEELRDFYEEQKLKLAFRMSSMFLVVFTILSFSYIQDSVESFLVMVLGIVISLVSLSFVVWRKKYLPSFYLYAFGGVFVTGFALNTFHNTIHLVDVLWMLAAVCLGFFGIGRRVGFILLGCSLALIVLFLFFALNQHIEEVQERTTFQLFSLAVEMVSAFLVNFYIFYLFMDIYRFSSRKLRESYDQLWERNQRIVIQNDEKTTLVREIHHRVKNNLQIVVSLLRMQSQEIESPEVKSLFQESINRIMTMSLIHQKLYQNENLSLIRVEDYLHDLTRELVYMRLSKKEIKYSIFSSLDKVGLKTIIPVGLLVNELVSNSLKHAFADVGEPEFKIQIDLQREGWICMVYQDNGHWEEKEEKEESSFGLILIDTLVEQLDGSKTIERNEKGTIYTFILQNIEELDVIA